MRARPDFLVHSISIEEGEREFRGNYVHEISGKKTNLLCKRLKMTVKDPSEASPAAGRVTRHRFQAYQIVGHSRSGHNASLPTVPDAADLPAKLGEPGPTVGQFSPRVEENPAQADFMVEMTREQVAAWMIGHGFEALSATFTHYTGTDMFRLTRQDLVNLCGAPQGTRLFYALRSKPAIRLTLYVSMPGKAWYHPLYMARATVAELASKLSALNVPAGDIYLLGPNGILVIVTDELISNINNEASLALQIVKDDGNGRSCIVLRPTTPPASAEP